MPSYDYLIPKSYCSTIPLSDKELNDMSSIGPRSPFAEKVTDIVCRARAIIGHNSPEQQAEETSFARDIWSRRQAEVKALEDLLRVNWICLDADGEMTTTEDLGADYLYTNHYFYRDDTTLFEVCEQIIASSERPFFRWFGWEYDAFYDELKRYFETELNKSIDVYFHNHHQILIKARIYQARLEEAKQTQKIVLREAKEAAQIEKQDELTAQAKKHAQEQIRQAEHYQEAHRQQTAEYTANLEALKEKTGIIERDKTITLLTDQLQALRGELAAEKEGVVALQSQLASSQKNNDSLTDVVTQLTQQRESLKNEVASESKQCQQQKTAIDSLTQHNKNLVITLETQEAALQVLKNKNKTLTNVKEKQKAKLEEKQNHINNQQHEVDRVKKENKQLCETVKDQQEKIEELSQTTQRLEARAKEVDQVSTILESGSKALNLIVQDQQLTIQEQINQLTDQKKQMALQQDTIKTQAEKIQQLEETRHIQEKQIKDLKSSLKFQQVQSKQQTKGQDKKTLPPSFHEEKSGTQISSVKGTLLGHRDNEKSPIKSDQKQVTEENYPRAMNDRVLP